MGNSFTCTLPTLPWEQSDRLIDHNTGSTDALRIADVNGNGVENVNIRLYVKSEYDTDAENATVRDEAKTLPDGRWNHSFFVNPQTAYVIAFHKSGFINATTEIPAHVE
jgi:hypothetical protein